MYNIGDKVSFLSDSGTARILEVTGLLLKIEDEHGFIYTIAQNEVVPFHPFEHHEIVEKDQKILHKKPFTKTPTKKEKEIPLIDLHMENLVESHHGKSNHEIVLTQLAHFRRFLVETEALRESKIIVVHGVGEGKLKSEIQLLVRGIPGASMYDADFKKFGRGASVVERKFNWR